MKRLIPIVLALLLAACANVSRMHGEQVVNDRLVATWAHGPLGHGPAGVWALFG